MTNERAYVVGASGYTGRALVRELRKRGIDCVAHIRRDSDKYERLSREFASLGASVDSTSFELGPMREALDGARPTMVFALLGTTWKRSKAAVARGESREANSYEAIDYALTKLVLDAAAEVAPRARFVYLSSIGVTENAKGVYYAARAKVERDLRASSLPWTIARPSFITGPDREESRPSETWGARLTDGGLSALAAVGLRGPYERYASMNAETLARALLAAALDPKCEGAVLEADALRRKAG